MAEGGRRRRRSRWGAEAGAEPTAAAPAAPAQAAPIQAPADSEGEKATAARSKVNFGLTGLLSFDAQSGNLRNGVPLKHSEPPEARIPSRRWRLYVYKDGKEIAEPMRIHRQSAYVIGKDVRVADIHALHPSVSKQHAVLQYRLVDCPPAPGSYQPRKTVKLYVLDLESANGTKLNGKPVEAARYYELMPGDLLQFALSSREYVVMRDDMAREDETEVQSGAAAAAASPEATPAREAVDAPGGAGGAMAPMDRRGADRSDGSRGESAAARPWDRSPRGDRDRAGGARSAGAALGKSAPDW